MSEPIKVGDLVVVVKGHCSDTFVGKVFKVAEMGTGRGRCNVCRVHLGTVAYVCPEAFEAYPLANVKRIPPFPELADEPEEITREQFSREVDKISERLK